MRFNLKVHSETVGVSVLHIDAASAEEAMRKAEEQGLVPFAVEAAGEGGLLQAAAWRRKSRFSLRLFSQQLLALIEAGLNMVGAVEALAEKEASPEMKAVLCRMLDSLYAGQTCSDAMAGQPDSFPPFYVATIRASERSGDIAESLRRYVIYQGQIEEVKKKVVSAMIYPVLLLVVGGMVTLFLLGYVVPKFSRIYEDRATDLPLLSRMLMQWGGVISHHGVEFLVTASLAAASLAWGAMHPAVRRWAWLRLWEMPGIGEKLRLYQLARLYRTLGMLLRGGTPIVGALLLVPGLLSPSLREQLGQATLLIREGRTISDALHVTGLTTPVSHRMLHVGEQSGRMGEMMERVATFHDDEIARWIDVFTKVFEPLLMALIGIMVGGVVVLMYMPIFELAGNIQ
jgi:general secretion pathway protein F